MKRSAEGSIYFSEAWDKWVARLRYTDAEGKSREKKRHCLTKRQAAVKLNELRAEIELDSQNRKTYRQVDQFYRDNYVHEARFVSGRKLSGFRQDIDSVRRYLDRALDVFGDRFIDSITYEELRAYKDKVANSLTVHGKQRSMSDINHHLKRLRRVFTVAVEQGWITVNPFSRGGSLINESFEVERTRILSLAEETRLLEACNKWRQHLRPVIVFAIETGCRRGEIMSLKWSSVNMQGRYLTIESATTKTLKSRMIPMSSRLIETMQKLWRNSVKRADAYVFGNSEFKTAFNKACANAGLPDVHFHDLRHTAITRMLEKGISPPLVMKISGHTQQKTFLRYVNQSESSIYELALRLDVGEFNQPIHADQQSRQSFSA